MRLNVHHVTRSRFDAPVRGLIQTQRLYAASHAGQTVLDWSVETPGAIRGAGFRDSAGDWVETITLRGPLTEAVVEVRGTVDTADTFGVLREHREKVPPLVYTTPTRKTQPDNALRELSADTLAGMSQDSALDRAHALSNAVADAIAYRPGETEAHTTAAEALAGGSGVCQDHTHALISVAQVAGIPARYVMGYLYADADGIVHEASHAWTELWVPDLGWVGFDVSNRCCPDDKYIRLGSGIDSVDAAPIRGLVQGSQPAEHLAVEVVVTAGQQQQQ
ncbi:transglutaminase family protein [Aestuariicoccus sp. MJ-SS9]|uniref:transglutaminase family protein n=1 Tax=Aestuariicoccus sp. MJ-SS9 TaxID=3079855 RepID=UPI00290997DF|nr:transglutaminase family protein [Aestuariicoccus sp. MJ-SS9]MDU8912401.1 transglutaminase family protein [Aestuariicoccus sp. MJ-SS9]